MFLNRQLLSINCNYVNKNAMYGHKGVNKIAFRSREKKKRTMRNSLKLTAEDNYEFLCKFREESEIALAIVTAIVKREELKLQTFQLMYCGPSEAFHSQQRIEEGLTDTKRFVIRVDEILKKYVPLKPLPPPVVVQPPAPRPAEPVARPEPAAILLLKRSTYNAVNDVFMEKVEPERLRGSREAYHADDFVSDSLVKRNLAYYDESFSHCKLSRNESFNPYVYCGKSNLNLSSNVLEAIKLQRYNGLLGAYACEDDKPLGFIEHMQDMHAEATQYIEQMKIGENFKNFVRNGRRAF